MNKYITGHCPACNAELNYNGSPTVIGGAVRYPVECNKCGFVGYEWWTMKFDNQSDINGKPFHEK